jgi:hypothetical protein
MHWCGDTVGVIGLRAKVMFYDPAFPPLHEYWPEGKIYSGYPYLLSMLSLWTMRHFGTPLQWVTYPIFPIYFVFAEVLIFAVCRKLGCSRGSSLLGVLLFLFSGRFLKNFTFVEANPGIILGFFLTAAVYSCVRWRRTGSEKDLALAVLMASAAGNVKGEGIIVSLLVFAWMGGVLLSTWIQCPRTRTRDLWRAGLAIAVSGSLFACGWYVYSRFKFPRFDEGAQSFLIGSHSIGELIETLRVVLIYMYKVFFTSELEWDRLVYRLTFPPSWMGPQVLGFFLLLFLIAFLARPRFQCRPSIAILWTTSFGLWLFFVLVFTNHEINGVKNLTVSPSRSIHRYLIPVYSLIAIAIAVTFDSNRRVCRAMFRFGEGAHKWTLSLIWVAFFAVGIRSVAEVWWESRIVDRVGPLSASSVPVSFDNGMRFLGYRVRQEPKIPQHPERDFDLLDPKRDWDATVYWDTAKPVNQVWETPDTSLVFSACEVGEKGGNLNWYYRPSWHPPSLWEPGQIFEMNLTIPPGAIRPSYKNFAVKAGGTNVESARSINRVGMGVCGEVQFANPMWDHGGFIDFEGPYLYLKSRKSLRDRTLVVYESEEGMKSLNPYFVWINSEAGDWRQPRVYSGSENGKFSPIQRIQESLEKYSGWRLVFIFNSEESGPAEAFDRLKAKLSNVTIRRFDRVRIVEPDPVSKAVGD